MLAHVIVSKYADHQPLHRQEKIFERHGVRISRKTMGGWLPSVAGLLDGLHQVAKKVLFASKVIGTDDTGVKVLDPKLPFARTGRIWPYLGDAGHPVIVMDYTPTRGRDGPAKFLNGFKGYLQADAYSVYDAFFKPARGLTEVGCMMHARRYFFKALDTDQERMGQALYLIARLYKVEERAKGLTSAERLSLRKRLSAPVAAKLEKYLRQIREEVLPKSPAGAAVRYTLNQWKALTRFLDDGDLEIDNGATERANRDIALGREFEIERPVARKQREHVIEKRNARFDLRLPGAVDDQPQVDVGFAGAALDGGGALRSHESMVCPRTFISSSVPTLILAKFRVKA